MKRVRLGDIAEEGVSHDPEIKKRVLLRDGAVPHVTTFAQARFLPARPRRSMFTPTCTRSSWSSRGPVWCGSMGKSIRSSPARASSSEPGERHSMACTGDEPLVLTYFGVVE